MTCLHTIHYHNKINADEGQVVRKLVREEFNKNKKKEG